MTLQELLPAPTTGDRVAWPLLLIAAALVSGVTFACVTPFSAFAVLLAATLPARRALPLMGAVWLVNQALGFCALGYPFDTVTLLWGGAIGIAALAATVAAMAVMAAVSDRWLRLASGFAVALIVYEGLLFLVSLVLGGSENFNPGIVATVALSDAAWLLGVAILRHLLVHLLQFGQEGRRPVTT
jgi:hypothetical protein